MTRAAPCPTQDDELKAVLLDGLSDDEIAFTGRLQEMADEMQATDADPPPDVSELLVSTLRENPTKPLLVECASLALFVAISRGSVSVATAAIEAVQPSLRSSPSSPAWPARAAGGTPGAP